MTNNYHSPAIAIAMSLLTGVAVGAAVASALHAQGKPAVYSVDQAFTDVDLAHADEYMKDYVPLVQASMKAYDGKVVAESSTVTTLTGSPPRRAAIVRWRNMDQFQRWYNSPEYRHAREISVKYADFHMFVVEGPSQ
jgi:uncharacterized protein (DUF1330 family)